MAGQYYGWSTPYNYLDAYQMQLDTNVLVNGSCLASNDTYDMVVCPANTYKLPQSAIAGLCIARGLPCPIVSAHLPSHCCCCSRIFNQSRCSAVSTHLPPHCSCFSHIYDQSHCHMMSRRLPSCCYSSSHIGDQRCSCGGTCGLRLRAASCCTACCSTEASLVGAVVVETASACMPLS